MFLQREFPGTIFTVLPGSFDTEIFLFLAMAIAKA